MFESGLDVAECVPFKRNANTCRASKPFVASVDKCGVGIARVNRP